MIGLIKEKTKRLFNKVRNFKITKLIIEVVRSTSKDELKGAPAEIAFFLVIAFVPALVFVVQIMTFFNIEIEMVTNIFQNYIPNEIEDTLIEMEMTQQKSFNSFYFITFTITMLWIVSKGYYSLERLSNITYKLKETRVGIFRRFSALVMTLFILIIIMGTIVFHVFSKEVIILLQKLLHSDDVPFFTLLKIVINLGLIFSLISLLMFVTPNKKIKYKHVMYGAVFTTMVWFLYSYFFGFYINHIASYDRFYGGLTGVIIFMLWVYMLAYSLFLGIQINYITSKNKITDEVEIRAWKSLTRFEKYNN